MKFEWINTAYSRDKKNQSVERLAAEREVAGSIPGAGPLLRFLKWLRNEGTSFALQAARPLRGLDDQVKWRSRLH